MKMLRRPLWFGLLRRRRKIRELQLVEVVSSRNAMEICIFAVIALSSSQTALGIRPLPGSLAQGGQVWGQVAASTLCLGCLVALLGLAWPRRDDGLAIEQLGLALTAIGCLFYAGAVYVLSGFYPAVFAIGFSGGIALASVVRYVQIEAYVTQRKLAGDAMKPANVGK